MIGRKTEFKWTGEAHEVLVVLDTDDWNERIKLQRKSGTTNEWFAEALLPKTLHQFKYLVDNEWKINPTQDRCTTISGHTNNFCMLGSSTEWFVENINSDKKIKEQVNMEVCPFKKISVPDVTIAYSSFNGITVLQNAIISNYLISYYNSDYNLKKLMRWVIGPVDDSNETKAKLSFILHLMKHDPATSSVISQPQIEKITLQSNTNSFYTPVVDFVNLFLLHPQVIDTLENTAQIVCPNMDTSVIRNLKNPPFQLVHAPEIIRGWTGLDCIYINVDHPVAKIPEVSDISCCTVALHELAHYLVRLIYKDINMSTPENLTNNTDKESGRIAEILLFGSQLDWVIISTNDVSSLLDLIDDFRRNVINRQSPLFPTNVIVPEICKRTSSPFAFDMDKVGPELF